MLNDLFSFLNTFGIRKLIRFKYLLILFFVFFISVSRSFSQNNFLHVRISILTCSPGQDLYSTFGHSAIRIFDSVQRTDIVYNWGTFDFSDPDFYLKFTRGKLLYFLSMANFDDFMVEFREDERSVFEQVLNLTEIEKTQVYQAIQQNLAGNNRYYHYDFLFDNCTTRIRDILAKATSSFQIKPALTHPHTTFRNLLYEYLDRGGEPWNKLGIDLLLGSKIDVEVTNYTAMFLPEYLMKGIDSAQGNGKKLVLKKENAFEAKSTAEISSNYEPLFLFSLLAMIVIALSFIQNNVVLKTVKIIDCTLFYFSGLLGILFLFMWFGTDQGDCAKNYNLIWALPTNFIAAMFVWKRTIWVKRYFMLVAIINVVLLLVWSFLPQQLNISLIPIIFLIAFRSYRLAQNKLR